MKTFLVACFVCIGCSNDSGGSGASGGCPLPDTYVVRYIETEGDCGPRQPFIGHRSDGALSDPECTTSIEQPACVISGTQTCSRKIGVTIRDWFLEKSGSNWTGEETLRIAVVDGSTCTSRYLLTVVPP